MGLKPGYKRTEVGVIPEEWEVKTLDALTTLLTNGFVGTATSAYVDSEEGIPYIQGYNVWENHFNFHGMKRVSRAFHSRNQKSCLQPGDILTIQTGDIGVTAVVPPELAGANCHALIISRLRNQAGDPKFYCHYFNSERGRSSFKEIETGTTMKHLNCGDMRKLLLPCPPVSEQRAIATALSDVDALLTQLDRLIAKKRDIKQAVMQELLTGKTRLPGFGGEWATRTIGELATTYGGLVGKSKADFGAGDAQYVTFLNVMSNSVVNPVLFDRVRVPSGEPQNLVRQGDLLLNGSSETPEEVGMCALVACDVPDLYLNSFCFGLRLRDEAKVDGLFLSYLIRGEPGRDMMKSLAQGSTRYNISKAAIRDAAVSIPELQEQTAVATLLSDLDAELAALEARRDKTRALKQGMMQELLTGRTRLI